MGELLGWEEKQSIVINRVELSVKARGLSPFASFDEKSSHPRKVTDVWVFARNRKLVVECQCRIQKACDVRFLLRSIHTTCGLLANLARVLAKTAARVDATPSFWIEGNRF
jgi:hypothetical protein